MLKSAYTLLSSRLVSVMSTLTVAGVGEVPKKSSSNPVSSIIFNEFRSIKGGLVSTFTVIERVEEAWPNWS